MKRSIIAAGTSLALGIIALLGVYAFVAIGRSQGEEWGSLVGPEPVWPAVIGFGALWVIPISALVLVVLVVISLGRAYFPRSTARD